VTSLFCFTTPAPLLISIAIEQSHKTGGDCIYVDFDDQTHAALKQAQLSPTPIRATDHSNWHQRDTAFKAIAMPGILDFPIPSTELPVWQVISLDRLNFFYRGNAQKEYDLVTSLNWDLAYVPLDIHHPLPWKLARNHRVMGVQAGPLRTREMRDMLTVMNWDVGIPFLELIVETQLDKAFVDKYGYEAKVYQD